MTKKDLDPAAMNDTSTDPNVTDSSDSLASIRKFIEEIPIDKSVSNWRTSLRMPPKLTFSDAKNYFWNLQTNKGEIRIQLLSNVAPMHVSSTIYLTELGFYDGLSFHRVIAGFMAQGGCPIGRGTGGPGYEYKGEFDRSVRHDRPGLLSMANAGPGTDGSQFFILFAKQPHLDNRHTIFGEVVDGMDTVRSLEKYAGPSPNNKPTTPLIIERATIEVE